MSYLEVTKNQVLHENHWQVYKQYMEIFVTVILPLLLLIALNLRIIYAIRCPTMRYLHFLSLIKPLVHLDKICLKSCLLNILDLTKLTM